MRWTNLGAPTLTYTGRVANIKTLTRTGSLPITLDVSVWVLAGRNGAKALVGVSLSVTAAHRVKDLKAAHWTF